MIRNNHKYNKFIVLSFVLVICLPICLSFSDDSNNEKKYWVFFKDKRGSFFIPGTYFNSDILEKIEKRGYSNSDSTDYPISPFYLSEIRKISSDIEYKSRWLNAVLITLEREQKKDIKQLSYVRELLPSGAYQYSMKCRGERSLKDEDSVLLQSQISSMNGHYFIQNGINGHGVRIAVLDNGFKGVDKNPVFNHLWKNNNIIDCYDFVKNRKNVFKHGKHGTMVLSCIAGKKGNRNLGLATGAEFLLARTEKWTEPLSEEKNWLAAAEWAYRNGADIINSSLGYIYHRYFVEDMDGTTSIVAKAAAIAASKGILVINAAGNEGNKRWEYIGTPADVESVLSVGGIDPETGYHIAFSSFGPTSDKRKKPNVSAYGKVIVATKTKLKAVYGTSFSAPLVSGFAACVLQLNPQYDNMEMFHQIEKSAHLYPYYDYAHGYGIPQADYFIDSVKVSKKDCFQIMKEDGKIKIVVKENMSIKKNNNYVYYHIENNKGILTKYAVISVDQHEVFDIDINAIHKNTVLRVHYNGVTKSFRPE